MTIVQLADQGDYYKRVYFVIIGEAEYDGDVTIQVLKSPDTEGLRVGTRHSYAKKNLRECEPLKRGQYEIKNR